METYFNQCGSMHFFLQCTHVLDLERMALLGTDYMMTRDFYALNMTKV